VHPASCVRLQVSQDIRESTICSELCQQMEMIFCAIEFQRNASDGAKSSAAPDFTFLRPASMSGRKRKDLHPSRAARPGTPPWGVSPRNKSSKDSRVRGADDGPQMKQIVGCIPIPFALRNCRNLSRNESLLREHSSGLPPAPRACFTVALGYLGLTPQALCCRLLPQAGQLSSPRQFLTQILFDFGPLFRNDAEQDRVSDSPAPHDHVTSQDPFLFGAESQNRVS
jgi:hypothetical protein